MPKRYRRNCDHCGIPYHGLGAKYCGTDCADAAKRAPDPDGDLPRKPDETIRTNLDETGGSIYVEASRSIKSHEELIERAGIDPDEWQITSHPIRTWSVPMKVKDEIHVVQMYYVGLTLKPKLEQTWDFKPLEIIVKPPKTRRPKTGGYFTSLHYSDVHYPHQDDAALQVVYDVLADIQPDHVVCHGDLLDAEQISKYPKDPYNRTSLAEEIQMGAQHLGEVTAITPDATHWLLEGNHEERLTRLIWGMAENRAMGELITLAGMREAMSWPKLLGLDALGWDWTPYGEHRLLRGKLVCSHGNAVRNASAYSAKAEHDAYRKAGISGHTHRMGTYYHTGYDGQVQMWVELGLLGKIRADYVKRPPNWQQGFAVLTWDGDRYGVEHIGIHEGRAFFRGRSYGSVVRAEEAA